MKKIAVIALVISLISSMVFCVPVSAVTKESIGTIEYLDNGDYIETVISDVTEGDNVVSPLAAKTITKKKTSYYKNSSGNVMWWVAIKATFTYNGSTSKCTSCSHSAGAPGSGWSIKSVSSSKSGNTATAKVIAVHTGATSNSYTRSVTIKCSAKGKVS